MYYDKPIQTLEDFYELIYAIPPRNNRDVFTPRQVTRSLLEKLDNPQDKIKSVLITGSKGKGSVATMLGELLSTAGKRVGIFVSPHLFDYRERIVVNGKMINERDLLRLAKQVVALAKEIESAHKDAYPRFFEITTVIAYLYFAERGVDYAVVEAGIGALTDATNQGSHLLSILTSIESEHLNQFNDMQQLALEKSGVMIARVPLILGDLPDTVDQLILDKATKLEVPVTRFRTHFLVNNSGFFPIKVGAGLWVADSRIKAQNGWIALNAFNQLDIPLQDSEKVTTLEKTKLPSREEIISKNPLIVLDSAHTRQSAQNLANYVEKSLSKPARKKVLLVSFSSIKNVNVVLSEFSDINKLVLTQATKIRSLSPEVVKKHIEDEALVGAGVVMEIIQDPMVAMQQTVESLAVDDALVVTGSVYLAGLISHEYKF